MTAAAPGAGTVPALPCVGQEVGARRWPYNSCHPDAWGTPHRGIVLAADDPRAGIGDHGLPAGVVPVLWSFGRVLFEPADRLHPYALDVALWRVERERARAKWSARSARGPVARPDAGR